MIDLFSGHFLETNLQGRVGWLGKLESNNGKKYINFSVACHVHKNVEWINCAAYERHAELINDFAKKGTEISIKGYNKTTTWKEAEKKRSKTIVVVRELGFISGTKNERKFESKISIEDYMPTEEENARAINYAKSILEDEGYIIINNKEEN